MAERYLLREDIPSWYSLSNYKKCSDFDAVKWSACLYDRRILMTALKSDPSLPLVDSLISLNRRHPCEVVVGFQIEYEEGGKNPPVMSFDPSKDSCSKGRFATAKVDLEANSEILIKSFIKWVEQEKIKRAKSIFNSRKKLKYSEWGQNGLLPYIDLEIWLYEENLKNDCCKKRISNELMVELVGYRKDIDTFRKSVKRFAKSLLDDEKTFQRLEVVAACEAMLRQEDSKKGTH